MYFIRKNKKNNYSKLKRQIAKYFLYAFCIITFAIFIRTVIGEPCQVPSESMSPTIQPGDWLWIDKLTYGGRFPERWADIPLLNVFTHIKSWRESDAKRSWAYRRMPGFTKPKIGDIIVFNSPENELMLLTKRITDIRIENGKCSYYVMGDNRGNSRDSRVYGWVPERLIVGKIHK